MKKSIALLLAAVLLAASVLCVFVAQAEDAATPTNIALGKNVTKKVSTHSQVKNYDADLTDGVAVTTMGYGAQIGEWFSFYYSEAAAEIEGQVNVEHSADGTNVGTIIIDLETLSTIDSARIHFNSGYLPAHADILTSVDGVTYTAFTGKDITKESGVVDGNGEWVDFEADASATGRYVKVVCTFSGMFAMLDEIEVYGTEIGDYTLVDNEDGSVSITLNRDATSAAPIFLVDAYTDAKIDLAKQTYLAIDFTTTGSEADFRIHYTRNVDGAVATADSFFSGAKGNAANVKDSGDTYVVWDITAYTASRRLADGHEFLDFAVMNGKAGDVITINTYALISDEKAMTVGTPLMTDDSAMVYDFLVAMRGEYNSYELVDNKDGSVSITLNRDASSAAPIFLVDAYTDAKIDLAKQTYLAIDFTTTGSEADFRIHYTRNVDGAVATADSFFSGAKGNAANVKDSGDTYVVWDITAYTASRRLADGHEFLDFAIMNGKAGDVITINTYALISDEKAMTVGTPLATNDDAMVYDFLVAMRGEYNVEEEIVISDGDLLPADVDDVKQANGTTVVTLTDGELKLVRAAESSVAWPSVTYAVNKAVDLSATPKLHMVFTLDPDGSSATDEGRGVNGTISYTVNGEAKSAQLSALGGRNDADYRVSSDLYVEFPETGTIIITSVTLSIYGSADQAVTWKTLAFENEPEPEEDHIVDGVLDDEGYEGSQWVTDNLWQNANAPQPDMSGTFNAYVDGDYVIIGAQIVGTIAPNATDAQKAGTTANGAAVDGYSQTASTTFRFWFRTNNEKRYLIDVQYLGADRGWVPVRAIFPAGSTLTWDDLVKNVDFVATYVDGTLTAEIAFPKADFGIEDKLSAYVSFWDNYTEEGKTETYQALHIVSHKAETNADGYITNYSGDTNTAPYVSIPNIVVYDFLEELHTVDTEDYTLVVNEDGSITITLKRDASGDAPIALATLTNAKIDLAKQTYLVVDFTTTGAEADFLVHYTRNNNGEVQTADNYFTGAKGNTANVKDSGDTYVIWDISAYLASRLLEGGNEFKDLAITGGKAGDVITINSYALVCNYEPVEIGTPLVDRDAEALPEADYSKVDEALEAAEALDESLYTEDSWAALQEAIDAVETGLPVTEQDKVDAMAKAINDAIAALEEVEPDVDDPTTSDPSSDDPSTSDPSSDDPSTSDPSSDDSTSSTPSGSSSSEDQSPTTGDSGIVVLALLAVLSLAGSIVALRFRRVR